MTQILDFVKKKRKKEFNYVVLTCTVMQDCFHVSFLLDVGLTPAFPFFPILYAVIKQQKKCMEIQYHYKTCNISCFGKPTSMLSHSSAPYPFPISHSNFEICKCLAETSPIIFKRIVKEGHLFPFILRLRLKFPSWNLKPPWN